MRCHSQSMNYINKSKTDSNQFSKILLHINKKRIHYVNATQIILHNTHNYFTLPWQQLSKRTFDSNYRCPLANFIQLYAFHVIIYTLAKYEPIELTFSL